MKDNFIDIIFRDARTYSEWQPDVVDNRLLEELVTLTNLGPTSANCSPLRIVFVISKEAKTRLLKHVVSANKNKVQAAPVTAILAFDGMFYNNMPKLFPHAYQNFVFGYANNESFAKETAFRNSSLQIGYFIIAARALGLDCGPLSGFDNESVDRDFFAETPSYKSNILCNLGYGDKESLHDRLPRLSFRDMADIL